MDNALELLLSFVDFIMLLKLIYRQMSLGQPF